MSIYLDRFLNMPPQRIPDAGPSANSASNSAARQLDRMLEMVDVRQQVEESAQAVSGYLAGNANPET